MPTIRQKLAFQKIVERRGNVSRAMREVNYSPKTAKNPKNLIESKGFQQLCDEIGLTDDFITRALFNDIKGKPKKRHKELELAFKVKGKLKGEEGGNTFNFINLSPEQQKRIAARILNGNPAGAESPNRLPDSDQPEV